MSLESSTSAPTLSQRSAKRRQRASWPLQWADPARRTVKSDQPVEAVYVGSAFGDPVSCLVLDSVRIVPEFPADLLSDQGFDRGPEFGRVQGCSQLA